jgi:hypothetical protein
MKNMITNILYLILISSFLCSLASAEKLNFDPDSGIELDKVITLGSSFLATVLFVISFIAYRRDGRRRLLYVTLAFFLFSIKGFLITSELFIPEREWVDPVASFFDFAILLSFFFGILKK